MKPEKIEIPRPQFLPRSYHFQIYTKGPNGETGYDIESGWIKAYNRAQAKLKIIQHYGTLFDSFIECYYANMNTGDKYAL